MKSEKRYYEGREIRVLCYTCAERPATITIESYDKYNQHRELEICDNCKNKLLQGLKELK